MNADLKTVRVNRLEMKKTDNMRVNLYKGQLQGVVRQNHVITNFRGENALGEAQEQLVEMKAEREQKDRENEEVRNKIKIAENLL